MCYFCANAVENPMSRKKILVCPLNWGIGHATRCVPLINEILQQGHEVILAADKAPLAFLQSAFPQLNHLPFPGFEPRYSHGNSQVWATLKSLPAMYAWAKRDHVWIEKAIQDHQIDGVIADNRFGAWSRKLPAVFITHQLQISIPAYLKGMKPIVNGLNHKYIRNFSDCWVPDYAFEPSLSGALSHPDSKSLNVHYIGPLSRFTDNEGQPETLSTAYDILAILSGPEPQRSLFERRIVEDAKDLSVRVCILRGRPGRTDLPQTQKNICFINHAADAQMIHLMHASKMVLSRPGYSTIMDLTALQKKAYFVPTPGQTEQMYLAAHMKKKRWFDWAPQASFSLKAALNSTSGFGPAALPDPRPLLSKKLESWLASL